MLLNRTTTDFWSISIKKLCFKGYCFSSFSKTNWCFFSGGIITATSIYVVVDYYLPMRCFWANKRSDFYVGFPSRKSIHPFNYINLWHFVSSLISQFQIFVKDLINILSMYGMYFLPYKPVYIFCDKRNAYSFLKNLLKTYICINIGVYILMVWLSQAKEKWTTKLHNRFANQETNLI